MNNGMYQVQSQAALEHGTAQIICKKNTFANRCCHKKKVKSLTIAFLARPIGQELCVQWQMSLQH